MTEEAPWRWLESTKHLQEMSFGIDFTALSGHELADYILVNAYSVNDEISEAMAEVQWKPWAKNRGEFTSKSSFIDELVDVGHFLANMLVAAGVTDEEWEERYRAKQGRNRARQAHGYDSVASKCPGCKRELDKPGALGRHVTLRSMTDEAEIAVIRCAGCGARLGLQFPCSEITWDKGVDIPGLSDASFASPQPAEQEALPSA